MNEETEMSESASVNTQASPTQTNGTGSLTFHGRIADLLDDVTVSAQPVAPAEATLDDLFAGAPSAYIAAQPSAITSEDTEALPRALPPTIVVGAAAVASPEPQPDAHSTTPAVVARDEMAPVPATLPMQAPPTAPAPPPLERAPAETTMTGVTYPAWVPPWDESQRPPTTQPATPPLAPATPASDVAPPQETPAPAVQPERSIFAPLALPVAPATAEQAASKPPADLPPFLATAALVARTESPPPVALVAPVADAAAAAELTATAVAADAEAEAPETETVAVSGAAALVSIRGRMDGLAVEVGSGPWPDVVAALAARLSQSASFFRAAKVALDLGQRALTEDELEPVTALLPQHGMTLALVRTGAERTFQSALALGLTVTLEAADGAAMAEAAAATSNAGTAGYFVYRGYLRSGNRLRRKEHVLVIGDVNPGAEVISDGDVLVWGRLRGIVHAGANGNVRAIVAALDMEPTQLRIADVMTTSPDPQPGQPGKWFWQRSTNKRPEVARLVHKAITFEEWDAGRPGGLVSLRRGG